jgi:hypothetical protein
MGGNPIQQRAIMPRLLSSLGTEAVMLGVSVGKRALEPKGKPETIEPRNIIKFQVPIRSMTSQATPRDRTWRGLRVWRV